MTLKTLEKGDLCVYTPLNTLIVILEVLNPRFNPKLTAYLALDLNMQTQGLYYIEELRKVVDNEIL